MENSRGGLFRGMDAAEEMRTVITKKKGFEILLHQEEKGFDPFATNEMRYKKITYSLYF